ncbi:MAG TPA: metal ABC transporter permease [Paracoccaceae bacterium]|nr:metal ABC transporter permease [Paracoccaceae bacterium]
MDDFLVRAGLAGIVTALIAAPLGCLVVWRRMAYFGDATAHAALLGVALALFLSLPVMVAVAGLAAAMAVAVTAAVAAGRYAMDTVLGVFAHSALAMGLVALAILPGVRVDLMAYLFGDILAVGRTDLYVIAAGGAAILAGLAWFWRSLVTATISPELMVAEGGSAARDRLVVTLLLALFVALAMKIVGVMLITSLLIIPAAAARPLARTPEGMALMAGAFGILSVLAGLGLSLRLDSPAGPSVILAAAFVFLAANLLAALRR